ncbi:MAG: Fmu (Sun) domain-containing protein, partial [Bacteroidetes bacterium]|nr:Fmu (Sun) domain-containing protein [Bacteroidota bacterium]
RVGDFLRLAASHITASPQVWDCCAASGGKSILAKDILGNIRLTVSDVRIQILQNLSKRFAAAGITQYQRLVLDLAHPAAAARLPAGGFDLIIADAPCSGSGTWGRTPESLTFFKKTEIQRYQSLQQKVVSAGFPRLRNGGCFLYITCSVFKKENEEIVSFIQQQFKPRLLKMELLEGYPLRADTLFAALFIKE